MATEKTDVVIVGMGAAGAILAAELVERRHEGDRAGARTAPDQRGFPGA